MMRLVRMASMIVVFCLLIAAVTAAADFWQERTKEAGAQLEPYKAMGAVGILWFIWDLLIGIIALLWRHRYLIVGLFILSGISNIAGELRELKEQVSAIADNLDSKSLVDDDLD